jgi:hypothetical protein
MEEQCAKQFENGREKEQLMSYIVVLFAVLTRFIPHMPNFSPVFGALLFGGAHLKPRDAIWYPLALLSASDVVLTTVVYGMRMRIGWGQAVTWVGFAVVALIGYWLRNRETLRNIGIAALAGPTAFFLGANFGVWIDSHGSHMYPATWDGLIACYFAALPFYRNSLVAGVVYTAALFGANQMYRRRQLGIASTVHSR